MDTVAQHCVTSSIAVSRKPKRAREFREPSYISLFHSFIHQFIAVR